MFECARVIYQIDIRQEALKLLSLASDMYEECGLWHLTCPLKAILPAKVFDSLKPVVVQTNG